MPAGPRTATIGVTQDQLPPLPGRLDRHRWLVIASAITLAVFVGLCAIGLPPGVPSTAGIASGLYNLLLGGGLALAFVAAGAGLGLLIAERCRSWLAAGPGIAVATGCALQLGLAHLLGWSGIWNAGPAVALAASLGLLIPGWAALAWHVFRAVGRRERAPATHPLWIMAAPSVAVMLAAAMSPPGLFWSSEFGGFDSLSYHLPLAVEWAAQGRVQPLEHNVYSFLPSYVEAAYAQIHVALGGVVPGSADVSQHGGSTGLFALEGVGILSCQLLSVIYAVIAAIATAAAARELLQRFGGDRVSASAREFGAAAAGAALLCTPWTAVVGSLAYNETAVMMCFGAAVWIASAGTAAPLRRGLLCGVLVGIACGCKPTALFLIGPAVGLVLAASMPRGSWLRLGAGVVTGGLIGFAPPLLRNALFCGNPVFPAATGIFGLAHWTADQAKVFADHHVEHAPLIDRLGMLFGTVQGGDGQPRGILHTQFVALWPLTLVCTVLQLRWPPLRRLAFTLAAGIALAMLWWLFGSHCQSRFLVPLLPACGILIGCGIASLAWRRTAPEEASPSDTGVWSVPPAVRLTALIALAMIGMSGVRTVTLFMTQGMTTFADGQRLPLPNRMLVSGVTGHTGEEQRPGITRAVRAGEIVIGESDPVTDAMSVAEYINLVVPADHGVYLLGDATPLYMPARLASGKLLYHVTWDRSPLGEAIGKDPDSPEAWTRQLQQQGVRWVSLNVAELSRYLADNAYDKRVTPDRVKAWLEVWGIPRHADAGQRILYELRPVPKARNEVIAAPAPRSDG